MTNELQTVETADEMDLAAVLGAFPNSQIRKSRTDGVCFFNSASGETLSSQGEKPLDLDKLITFLQVPWVQYDVYMDDEGKATPKEPEEQKQLPANLAFPYASLYATRYVKVEQVNASSGLQVVRREATNMDYVWAAFRDHKNANIRVSIVYPAIILYDGEVSLGLVQQGKYALWPFIRLAPAQSFSRIGELTNALNPQVQAKLNFATGKLEAAPPKGCVPVMWDEPVNLSDPSAPESSSNRGLHLLPAKADSEGVPFVKVKSLFGDKKTFDTSLAQMERLMSTPEFQQEIHDQFVRSLSGLIKKRYDVGGAEVVEIEVEAKPGKNNVAKEMTDAEKAIFDDDSV